MKCFCSKLQHQPLLILATCRLLSRLWPPDNTLPRLTRLVTSPTTSSVTMSPVLHCTLERLIIGRFSPSLTLLCFRNCLQSLYTAATYKAEWISTQSAAAFQTTTTCKIKWKVHLTVSMQLVECRVRMHASSMTWAIFPCCSHRSSIFSFQPTPLVWQCMPSATVDACDANHQVAGASSL